MDSSRIYSILRISPSSARAKTTPDSIAVEYTLTIRVNGQEVVGMHCSPSELAELAAGFLYGESILQDARQLDELTVDVPRGQVDVTLKEDLVPLTAVAKKRIQTLTSACGRAVTFSRSLDAVSLPTMQVGEKPLLSPKRLAAIMSDFMQKSRLLDGTGCMHRCAIIDGEQIVYAAQDIGRHNAMDKVVGHLVLAEKLRTHPYIAIATGRISSDIAQRAAMAQIPMLVSRSAPTSRAVDLADSVGLTLIGFARGERMNVYTHPRRLVEDDLT
ncbi:formate dehydrogenase accessory sulfurtransferase FdhD [bacterium]|nr:formate dehydrogenase accessory sulfurtransferase FdhD [bacterium]